MVRMASPAASKNRWETFASWFLVEISWRILKLGTLGERRGKTGNSRDDSDNKFAPTLFKTFMDLGKE